MSRVCGRDAEGKIVMLFCKALLSLMHRFTKGAVLLFLVVQVTSVSSLLVGVCFRFIPQSPLFLDFTHSLAAPRAHDFLCSPASPTNVLICHEISPLISVMGLTLFKMQVCFRMHRRFGV